MKRLSEFRNEPYTDFTVPANRERMLAAQEKVRGELGREYPLLIGGEQLFSDDKQKSLNPSRPSEVVGTVQKATPEMAERAVLAAYEYFPEWSRTPASLRIEMLVKTAAILRERKNEFNAWLAFEAGKTWPEAEGEVAEAVDFCEY
ncbi:MAG TPA: aldehyde dehydrogenase family protein, partial [Casimicrobiaceae bacterium]